MTTNERSTTSPPLTRPRRLLITRMVQNFHLVWLDGRIHEDDCRNSITNLQQVFNTVSTFINADKCIDFISNIQEKTFMVISDEFSQTIIPVVQDIPQVNYIYILSDDELQNKTWSKEWSKVSGVYTDTTHLCEALRQATQNCDHGSFSISFVKKADLVVNQSLDTIHSSFMYTQILKEILLTIDFDEGHIKNFLTYCCEQFAGNYVELRNIDMVEKEYRDYQPIWWYTYDRFFYFMLNRALRTMEVDLITKMGFFVRDLHNHITKLHSEQYGEQKQSNSFVVYRGESLSKIDFSQLKATQGGVLVFNNFLVQRGMTTADFVGALFAITVDPSISATPFANVKNASYYEGKDSLLHAFRFSGSGGPGPKYLVWQ